MSRTKHADYAGAAGRITYAQVERLSPSKWVLQPKIDGVYVRISLDHRGRIATMLYRSGKPVSRAVADGLYGQLAGEPYSVLCGELEAHTEASKRAATMRGYGRFFIFDAVRIGERYVARDGYAERRDRMYRAWAELWDRDTGRGWRVDGSGRAHDRSGRFVRAIPHGWRRCLPVPQWPLGALSERWAAVDRGEEEGLVVVSRRANLGARRAKLKLKPRHEVDCTVVRVSEKTLLCHWVGADKLVVVGRRKAAVKVGQIVTLGHLGYYDSGEPKHAYLSRVRDDLC